MMFNKKIIFIFIFFCILLTNVNAIVVSDISDQIQEGNQSLIENYAKTESSISQMKSTIIDLQNTINDLKNTALLKDDMYVIRENINSAMIIWQQQLLIMGLIMIFFSFGLLFLFRSKGWV